MENSFQHFQEMINEVKALNEKHLDEAKRFGKDNEEKKSLKTIKTEDEAREDVLDSIPGYEPAEVNRQTANTLPFHLADKEGIRDKMTKPMTGYGFVESEKIGDNVFDATTACSIGTRSGEQVVVDQPVDQLATTGANVKDFEFIQMKDLSLNELPEVSMENENEVISSPNISNEVNMNLAGQLSERNEIHMVECGQTAHYYESSPRPLSVIAEETRISDDELSEGVLEEDLEISNVHEDNEHQIRKSLSHAEGTDDDYFTDFDRQCQEELQDLGLLRDVVGSELKQSFSRLGDHSKPKHILMDPSPYCSHESPPQNIEEQHELRAVNVELIRERESDDRQHAGGTLTSVEASKKFGVHVDLPTFGERSSTSDPSSSAPTMNDVVLSGMSSLSLSQSDDSSRSATSLQEAFRKNRPQFFRHSQDRVLRAKRGRHLHSPFKGKQDAAANMQESETAAVNKRVAAEGKSFISVVPNSEKDVLKSPGRLRLFASYVK